MLEYIFATVSSRCDKKSHIKKNKIIDQESKKYIIGRKSLLDKSSSRQGKASIFDCEQF